FNISDIKARCVITEPCRLRLSPIGRNIVLYRIGCRLGWLDNFPTIYVLDNHKDTTTKQLIANILIQIFSNRF
ncbi:MAG: hypothetical protein RR199_07795, partial [Alistipes sp.]